jgi:hypothetical protein
MLDMEDDRRLPGGLIVSHNYSSRHGEVVMDSAARKDSAGGWIRSSWCGNYNCVEIRRGENDLLMRSSLDPGVILKFDEKAWSTFLDRCRHD